MKGIHLGKLLFLLSALLQFNIIADTKLPKEAESPDVPEISAAEAWAASGSGIFRVLSFVDLDNIVLENEEHLQIVVKLEGLLPFSRWPMAENNKLKSYAQTARKFVADWIENSPVHFIADNWPLDAPDKSNPISGYIYRYIHGATAFHSINWDKSVPSQFTKWGGVNLNALLIENGFTVRMEFTEIKMAEKNQSDATYEKKFIIEAEKYAKDNEKGIWKESSIAKLLTITASKF